MIKDNDIIGGNAEDNGPLDAFLKGEQLSADALIEIRLQEVFALKARERNEHQDFEDRGGCCRGRGRRETWARQHRLNALETAHGGFGREFSRAAGDAAAVAAKTALMQPVFAPPPVLGA